ncbi:MAG: hypothetical protein WDN04_10485 [Rhodospirillales bacterium]
MLRRYGVILPRTRFFQPDVPGSCLLCFPAAVGTYERTALVGMAIVLIGLWLRLRRRALVGALGAIFVALTLAYGISGEQSVDPADDDGDDV